MISHHKFDLKGKDEEEHTSGPQGMEESSINPHQSCLLISSTHTTHLISLVLNPYPLISQIASVKKRPLQIKRRTPRKFKKRGLGEPIDLKELFPTLFQPIIVLVAKILLRIMELTGDLIAPSVREDLELSSDPLLKIDKKDIMEIRSCFLAQGVSSWAA